MAAPTVTIVVTDPSLIIGETSLVTFTFSEAIDPTSFTVDAVKTFPSGAVGAITTSDNIVFTATFTPAAATQDTTNAVTVDLSLVFDAALVTSGAGVTSSNNYAVDTVRPTATIVVADSSLLVGETSLVTVTFSEAATGLTNADLSVANGTLSAISSSDGGLTWTATLTPTVTISDTTNIVTLDNTGVTDLPGNAGVGTTNSNNYAIDTTRPTATIVVADNALAVGETSLVTFTFSEAVTGFSNADLTIEGGALTAVASGDGGITWTATLTPTAAITDTTNVITLANTGVTDAAGNTGTATTLSNNYAIDTARPTATIVVADSSLIIGETSLVTVTFSEAVTGFTNADLTLASGTLGAVSTANGGLTWTATFTPTAAISDTTNLITLDNTGVTDAAGNAGAGTTDSNNFAVDTTRPTATIVVADAALAVGETSAVTITFSEAVTGLTNADLTVANGTLDAVSSSNGGVTWTATFTPSAAITDTTNLITLDNTGVTDVPGNAGLGTTNSNNYAIDTVRPTASIVVTDNSLVIGETSLVTITFSEAVTGFTNADLTVEGGTLAAVASGDGGITWTAILTPTVALTDPTNVVTLANTGVTDSAGNTGLLTTASNNYAIDGVRPTASIALADTALTLGETSGVTITFSEAVTGFTNADLTIEGGTLSAVATSNNVVYTATFTPKASLIDATNTISLANSGVADVAGNAGGGTSTSSNFTIDTVTVPPPSPPPTPPAPPVAPIQMPGTTGADIIVGNELGNVIAAGDSDDRASGGIGSDTITGDAGNDTLQGNIGSDNVSGGVGNDVVLGGQDGDVLQGNTDADYVSGDKGNDTVLGGQGNDTVYGGESNDYVSGDLGADIVRGGQGNDMLLGGAGNDFVSGDRGNDTLSGGVGADIFHGFGAGEGDLVIDFNLAEGDRVMLDTGTVYTLAQVGLDTVITMEGGSLMTLANVQLAALTPGWIFLG